MSFQKVFTSLTVSFAFKHLFCGMHVQLNARNCYKCFYTDQRQPNKNKHVARDRVFGECFPKKPLLMDIRGKTGLIIGGTTGLGTTVAHELLKAGAGVVICTAPESKDKLDIVQGLREKFGQKKALYFPTNIDYDEDFQNLFNYINKSFRKVDIIFNCGGIWCEDDWEACIDVNIGGTVRSNLMALDRMSKLNKGCGGVIVNCASILGFDALPSSPAFCATQRAIVAFSECLGDRFHQEKTRVRVITLCPDIATIEQSLESLKRRQVFGFCPYMKGRDERRKTNPYAIARAFLYIVRYGISGHHYVVDGSVLSEVTLPPRQVFSKPLCRYKKKIFGLL